MLYKTALASLPTCDYVHSHVPACITAGKVVAKLWQHAHNQDVLIHDPILVCMHMFDLCMSLACRRQLSVCSLVAQQHSENPSTLANYACQFSLFTAAIPDISAPCVWWAIKADKAQHHFVHGGPLALDVAMLDSLGATSSPQLPRLASSPSVPSKLHKSLPAYAQNRLCPGTLHPDPLPSCL